MSITKEDYQKIGQRIRAIRLEKKYTQAQFAEVLSISNNYVSDIENGKKGMSQETLYTLCTKFEVSADYVLFGDQEKDWTEVVIESSVKLRPSNLEYVIQYLQSLYNLKHHTQND